MKRTTLVMAAVALPGGMGQVRADLLYDNGAAADNQGGYAITTVSGFSYQISDSFNLTQSSLITEVQVGLLTFTGNSVTSLDWTISTGPTGGSVTGQPTGILASGTASTTDTYLFTDAGTDIAADKFQVNVSLDPGTYYLSLQNAVGTVPSEDFANSWQTSNGPSSAYINRFGNLANLVPGSGTQSQSFQLYGQALAAPDPSGIALFGLGVVCLAIGYASRRRKLALAAA